MVPGRAGRELDGDRLSGPCCRAELAADVQGQDISPGGLRLFDVVVLEPVVPVKFYAGSCTAAHHSHLHESVGLGGDRAHFHPQLVPD